MRKFCTLVGAGALMMGIIGTPGVALAAPVASPVADAVQAKDRTALRALIAKKDNINAPQADGSTALHWAAYWNDLETAQLLVKAGADVKASTRLGATPLYLAAENGSAPMVKLLLDAGADAKATVLSNGETPLMFAARSGNVEAVKLLLDAGAFTEAKDTVRETTALLWAAEQNHAAVVSLLIARGADAAAISKIVVPAARGRGPAPAAGAAPGAPGTLVTGAAAAARAGAPGAPARAGGAGPAAGGQPAAAAAAPVAPAATEAPAATASAAPAAAPARPARPAAPASGSEGSGPSSSPAPAPAAIPDNARGGLSALMLATRENGMATVKALLDGGAPIDQQSADGTTALLVATQNGHAALAKFLIERGANVSLGNKKGWNPLYLAIKARTMEQGTMPNPIIDKALMYDVIAMMLEKGADVNARLNADTEVHNGIEATWLREAGATPFLRAAFGGDLPVMKLLLKHGADPKISTKDNTTTLMALAGVGWAEGFCRDFGTEEESLEGMKILIEAGVEVNAVNTDKVSALHGAAHKNFTSAIQLLVDHGADLAARSQRASPFERKGTLGNTALDWASGVQIGMQSSIYHPEAVQLVSKLMQEKGLAVEGLTNTKGGFRAK